MIFPTHIQINRVPTSIRILAVHLACGLLSLVLVGCENSDQAPASRTPTTGPSIPLVPATQPAKSTTQPTTAPATQPAEAATQPTTRPTTAPATQPTTRPQPEPADEPVPEPIKMAATPVPDTQPETSFELTPGLMELEARRAKEAPDTRPADSQTRLLEDIQKKNLALIRQLEACEERNFRLTKALIEARHTARELTDQNRRSTIVNEIQKRQIQQLRDRIAMFGGPEQDVATTRPATQPTDPQAALDMAMELSRARETIRTLELQLKLARLDAPQRTRALLDEQARSQKTIADLQQRLQRLSHLVVEQNARLRNNQAREEKQARQLTETAEQLRQVQARLADSRQAAARQKETIATLRQQLAERSDSHSQRSERIEAITRQLAKRRDALDERERQLMNMQHQLDMQRQQLVELAEKASPPTPVEPGPEPVAVEPGGPADPQPLRPDPTRPISGKVSAVRGPVVIVDVGTAHGLEKGSRLIVYRGAQLVGLITLEEISENESAGTFTRKLVDPKVGDNVIDRLE